MAVTGDLGGKPVTLNNAAEENTLQDIKSLLGQTTKAANINANNINTANIAAGKAAGGLSSVANSSGYASKSLDNVSNSVRQWSKDARENIAMATTAFGRSVTSTGASLSSRLSMMGEGAQKLLEGLPGLLGTVSGAAAGIIAGQIAGVAESYEKAQASGGSFGNSMMNYADIANQAGLTMGQLQRIATQSAEALSRFGGTTNQGARQFARFNKGLQDSPLQADFIRMGMSIEQQGIAMAEYTGNLARFGADLGTLPTKQVVAGMANLTRQQKMFATINGTTLDQERQKAKQQAMDIDSRVIVRGMEADQAETALKFIEQMGTSYGTVGAQYAKEMLVHGRTVSVGAGQFASSMPAVAGPMGDLAKGITKGQVQIEDLAAGFGSIDQTAANKQLDSIQDVLKLTVGTGMATSFTDMGKSLFIPATEELAKLTNATYSKVITDANAVSKAAQGLDHTMVALTQLAQESAKAVETATQKILDGEGGSAVGEAIASGTDTLTNSLDAFTNAINQGGTFTDALGAFTSSMGSGGGGGGGGGSWLRDAIDWVTAPTADRALGGPVIGGNTYRVNEQGQEFFTPQQNGNISPASGFNQIMGGIDQQIAQLQQIDLNKEMQAMKDRIIQGDGMGGIMHDPTASVLDQETKDAIMILPSILSANIDAIVNADQNTQDGLKDLSRSIA